MPSSPAERHGGGETSLPILLRDLEPARRPGAFVFTTVDEMPADLRPVVTVVEDEGTTIVVEKDVADSLGLPYGYVAAMITLRVHSGLHAVGLTAAVASALAAAGISCNVVAGSFHDHLFVPIERGEEAAELLEALAKKASEQLK